MVLGELKIGKTPVFASLAMLVQARLSLAFRMNVKKTC